MIRSLGKIPLTREHGAWAMFIVPIAVGAILADAVRRETLLFGAASLALFLAYHPLEVALHAKPRTRDRQSLLVWAVAFCLMGALPTVALLAMGRWSVAPLGVLVAGVGALRLWILQRRGKGILSDLAAVAGLSLGAPATFTLSVGVIDRLAILAWLVCLLFLGSTVFYVHMKMAALKLKKITIPMARRVSLGRLNLLYHCVVVGIVLGAAIFVRTPAALLAALGPMAIHAVWGTICLTGKVRLKRLGILLLGHSVVFLVLVAAISKEGLSR